MQIWVDADACPKGIKEILYRAAERQKTLLILVSNQPLRIPASPYINVIRVSSGFNVADDKIVQQIKSDDLVITADIPLAAAVVEKGAYALNPRGEFYTLENIHERLAVRNLMNELRSNGIDTGGPSTFNQSDHQAFANQLDKFFYKSLKASLNGK